MRCHLKNWNKHINIVDLIFKGWQSIKKKVNKALAIDNSKSVEDERQLRAVWMERKANGPDGRGFFSFLYQMIIWYLVVYPDSFALTSLHTGHFSEKSLKNIFWKSLYMKLSIFRYLLLFFSKIVYILCNLHKMKYSLVCDVILTGLGSALF